MKKLIKKDGKYYEECDIVMSPTEKPALDSIFIADNGKFFMSNQHEGLDYPNPHYLYVLSKEEIKEGDWFVVRVFGKWKIQQWDRSYAKDKQETNHILYETCKKIIAATDESLALPSIPKEFLKQFCEAGGIWKVLVEQKAYFESMESCMRGISPIEFDLKVSSDNTIKPIQKENNYTMSHEKLRDLLIGYGREMSHMGISSIFGGLKENNLDIDNWIEQNLK